MSFSRHLSFAALTVGLVLLMAPQMADAAKRPKPKFQIKFATLAPEGSTWMKKIEAIDDEVRRRTDNRLGFKFYPGGVQGDEKEVLRKIRNGQLHGGGFSGFGLGSLVPEVRVQELPFMFESLDELDYLREQTNEYFWELFKDKGYLNLGWADVGFVYIYSKKPIQNPAELNAAKMWVWAGDPLAELFFKAFEISPIPLAAPDVLTSLQTGIIDAVYNSPLGCMALQWFTRIDYMTDIPISHSLGAALISMKALKKVDPADVAILLEVSRPLLRELTEKTRIQNQEAIGEIQKENVQLLSVDEDVRAEFFASGREAWGDGVGQLYSQELLDRVKGILADYRAGRTEVGSR
jgi:TRAP-type C4-dicarboxylate transport system substrate-binding protein